MDSSGNAVGIFPKGNVTGNLEGHGDEGRYSVGVGETSLLDTECST